jgi:DNA-3-methyladenine glycosylase
MVNGERIAGRIIETEAYLGIEDRACHTFGDRRTERTRSMYLPGGHAYVYLIYGLHYCFNVVTRSEKEPEAVLIRAVEPLEGVDFMRSRRRVRKDKDLANGPGKLCEALAIDRKCDGLSLNGEELFIERGKKIDPTLITASARVGVDYAGDHALWPLRFRIASATPSRG